MNSKDAILIFLKKTGTSEKHECERSPRDRGAKKLNALLNGCLQGIIFAFLVTKVYFSFGG